MQEKTRDWDRVFYVVWGKTEIKITVKYLVTNFFGNCSNFLIKGFKETYSHSFFPALLKVNCKNTPPQLYI